MLTFPTLRQPRALYDPDVQAWIDGREAVSDPVPTAYANAVNQYILDLKEISGHWATITQLLVPAGVTTVAGGLVPIKGVTPTHSNLANGDFALKTGVRGNTTNKHIASGYDNTSFPQNDMHAYVLVTGAPTVNTALFGNGGTSSGAVNLLWNSGSRGRAGTIDNFSGTTLGGYGVNRSNSTEYQRMVADSVSTITRASQTPNASPFYVLARSSNNSSTPNSWVDARILVWAIGTATTLTNYTTPGSTLQTALNAI